MNSKLLLFIDLLKIRTKGYHYKSYVYLLIYWKYVYKRMISKLSGYPLGIGERSIYS